MRLEREYSNATASRLPRPFLHLQHVVSTETRRRRSDLVGPATSYFNQAARLRGRGPSKSRLSSDSPRNRGGGEPMSPRGAGATTPAGASGRPDVGWEAAGGRAQARRGAQDAGASASGGAPGPVAAARHVAYARGGPLSAVDARPPVAFRGPRRLAQGSLSRGPLLGPDGPHPPHRRGRRSGEPRARAAGARGPLREGRQPRIPPPRRRLGQSLPRSCAAHAVGGQARARLRPPRLPKAPASGARRRSAELRSLVRRLAATRRAAGRRGGEDRLPGRPREDVARLDRVATGGRPRRARRGSGGAPRARPGQGQDAPGRRAGARPGQGADGCLRSFARAPRLMGSLKLMRS